MKWEETEIKKRMVYEGEREREQLAYMAVLLPSFQFRIDVWTWICVHIKWLITNTFSVLTCCCSITDFNESIQRNEELSSDA